MMPYEIPLLRSAVEKLGPIGAQNALTAFKTGRRGTWESCVLARAYGADGELKREVRKRKGKIFEKAHQVLGLTYCEAEAIVRAFDARRDPVRQYLRMLLEEQAAKLNENAGAHVSGRTDRELPTEQRVSSVTDEDGVSGQLARVGTSATGNSHTLFGERAEGSNNQ